MRRRDVLAGAGGLVGLAGLAGPVGGTPGRRSTAEPYAPLGSVELPGAAEAVVGDGGATAYVATGDGFATVDVSDPANPTVLAARSDLLADREDGPMRGILDLTVDGDRLLVAGPANRNVEVFNGVVLYDVSDPAAPERVGVHRTRNNVHNCFLVGETAYLTAGSAGHRLSVVDLSTEDPAEVASWDPTVHDDGWADVSRGHRTIHDVYVQDGRAYLAGWDAGTFVLDVGDPADPTYVTHVSDYTMAEAADLGRAERFVPPGNHHYARVSEDGSLLAVGRESWDVDGVDGGPGGITLYDLSSSTPTELASVAPERARDETFRSGTWTTSHNFDLRNGRLYSSWYQGGVKIHDVSDPAAPELLAWWRQPDDAAFWTARFAADGTVVASAHAIPTQDAPFQGLYTFPDRAGEQADPPVIPTPTPTASPTSTTTPADTATPNPATGDGFGLVAALSALGGAAWWRRRRE